MSVYPISEDDAENRREILQEIAVLPVPVFSTLCNQAFRLRRDVFIVEQSVPESEEFDADDLEAFHVVAIGGGEVCGTLRVIHAEPHVKIGRVVVERSCVAKASPQQ